MSVTIAAMMTAPRYECVTARNHIQMAMYELGIPLAVSSGVYYHQCMQHMMEDAVASGVDLLLTIDGDSLFTASQVKRLVGRMCGDDTIDALAPVQVRRNVGTVLASVDNGSLETIDGLALVDTAHFGLTVFRGDALRRVAKPWFYAQPDSLGGWGEGKIDADVWFWKQWQAAGCTLFLDTEVSIGHIEETVAYFDERNELQRCYVSDWLRIHSERPAEVTR